MNETQKLRDELVALSHELGAPEMAMAILGEGNVSARSGDDRFLVKASGSQLRTLAATQLTEVRLSDALEFLDTSEQGDEAVAKRLESCKIDPKESRPSVETFMHAVCLTEGGAKFVGHTHPEAINSILCSNDGATGALGPIFPDQIVVCGLHWLTLPYVDPGVALAVELRSRLRLFREEYGVAPKLILLENHGAVALGKSAREVSNILQMAHKWARIALGTFAAGGPRFMPEDQARRIDGRDDERIRRKALGME